ncbi:hypothetical protein [Nitrosospira sp. Nsp2]|uniref:hypothetical protein n=1 Tax=Nitrosospira sp. Nsp2 TaxID=136548 RepID=UPI0015E7D56F|nr:hypothetical protein [Nitrosospira sp. Nsp2]
MDQNEMKKYDMPWYDWAVFAVPALFFIGLGIESALGPSPADGVIHRDFRAIAHWFDPVFFQYNLVMALLTVLVVPSLALSYIQAMANRKERRLQNEVPPERRAEVRRRMGRRASFSSYRGSVWLTTTVVLLGTSILLLFKPVSVDGGTGVDFGLGANMLIMGPFAELYEKNPDAYYSHLIRNQIAFQFGFLGAYVYFVGSVVRAYFTMDLTSHTFVDGAIRMIVASILALVLSFAYDFVLPGDVPSVTRNVATADGGPAEAPSASSPVSEPGDKQDQSPGMEAALPANLSLLPIVAFFFGFYPKRASLALERVALKVMKNIIPGDGYRALPLSMLAGMSYSHELRLEREGFDNVENLSNADAVDLAVRTCFSYPQLKQWIDAALLASHLREDYPYFVRRSGLSASEELHYFLSACDAHNIDGVQQLVAALSTDPAEATSWKLRLTALKILLDKNAADNKCSDAEGSEHRPGQIVSLGVGLGVGERSP